MTTAVAEPTTIQTNTLAQTLNIDPNTFAQCMQIIQAMQVSMPNNGTVAPQFQLVQVAKPKTERMTVAKAFDEYINAEVIPSGMAANTVKHWKYMKLLAVNYCSGEPNRHGFVGKKVEAIQDLELDDVIKYREYLCQWIRQDGVRKALTALRKLLQWLDMCGYEVLNPGFIGLPKHEKRQIEWLSREEVRDFIDIVKMPRMNLCEQARLRNVAICEVLFSSGIRVSELIKLDRDSIKNRKFVISGKSKNSRPCFISKRAEKALNEYLATRVDHCCALFISTQEDKRMTDQSVRHFFKKACRDSDFCKIHPHTMRHSFATYLLEKGVDIVSIANFLGHENLQTTQLYTHVSSPKLQLTHDRIMARV